MVPREPDRTATAAPDMTNIPTELLRTLVTLVELRSFTKAAHALGMTQPAVSAQIKRLQVLLGGELLDTTSSAWQDRGPHRGCGSAFRTRHRA